MFRAVAPLVACAMMLGVVACGKRDPVDSRANSADLPAINDAVPNATGAPPEKGAAVADSTASAELIPASLRGRWGLTPMDCTSTRGDAKGLLMVGPAEVRFYESRAVPAKDAQTGTDSISGNFSFTGEGQSWTKFEAFELKGQELVRTDSNPMASFTYARCK
ncbi:MAG TPA: hypothetical protein VF067_05455 [Sphingomicrobium sp.]